MIRVKICGITNVADAEAAAQAGADLIGLNFYERSPRFVSPEAAAKIRDALPKGVEAVGIFVNHPPREVIQISKSLRLDAAQLHGDEAPEMVTRVSANVPVFKAFRVDPQFALSTLEPYADASAFLLDASQAGQYGGTGHTIDWALARRAAASHRIILAGGLKPENIASAIRIVRPYAVDVASGVEGKPGKKDHSRVREFIEEVRRAETQLNSHTEASNAL
jgi:phosphoribosylanthranilate isomerase